MTNTKHKMLMEVLTRALTVKRPHGSPEEQEFVAYLAKLLPITSIDGAGNLYIKVGESKTLFTAHTDTVHKQGGVNKVTVDGKFWRATDDVLGADDGAGVAILAHMIEHKIPGLYVLFRGEESGGIGSGYMADNYEDLLKQYSRAIAFDRAGYYDVITHQAGGRCCSDEFATALAKALSDDLTWMMPSNLGVYTDTAEFTSLIPECTNISVGYQAQHSDKEEQDVDFLKTLADRVLTVKWEELPTTRVVRQDDSWLHERICQTQSQSVADRNSYYEECNMETVKEMEHALVEFKKGSGKTLGAIVLTLMEENYGVGLQKLNLKMLSKETVGYCLEMLQATASANEVAEEIYYETVVI